MGPQMPLVSDVVRQAITDYSRDSMLRLLEDEARGWSNERLKAAIAETAEVAVKAELRGLEVASHVFAQVRVMQRELDRRTTSDPAPPAAQSTDAAPTSRT
jgi:hypothetical protein